jgi:hypothetical protein
VRLRASESREIISRARIAFAEQGKPMAGDAEFISAEEFEQFFGGEGELRELQAEFGDEEHLVETRMLLNFLKWRWETGNRLAPFWCVKLCRERHARLPVWAFDALASGGARYLSGESLNRSLLDQSERGGRHSDPRKREGDEWKKVCAGLAYLEARAERDWCEMVFGPRLAAGIYAQRHGKDDFERAAELCAQRYNVHFSASTIEQYWKRHRRLILAVSNLRAMGFREPMARPTLP